MSNETLTAQCESALQKQALRRMKKLAYLLANRHRLKHLFKRANCASVLLSMTRLTKREERMTDVQFECLDFGISEGKVKSTLNTKKYIRHHVWGTLKNLEIPLHRSKQRELCAADPTTITTLASLKGNHVWSLIRTKTD